MKPATLILTFTAAALVFLALSPPALHAAFTLDDLKKNPSVDFTIITEMTDAGRALPAVTPDKPVYYNLRFFYSTEQPDNGGTSGEARQILYSSLEKQFASALAYYDYRPNDKEHPPTQLFVVTWGASDKIALPNAGSDNGDEDSGTDKTVNTSFQHDLLTRAKAIGGQKFANEFAQALNENDMKRFSSRDDVTETLVYLIYNGYHGLYVTSFDLEALKKHEKKLLWNTKIFAVSREISPEMTPPDLIHMAAYYLGRNIDGPEIVRKPSICGDLPNNKAADYISGSTLIITDTAAPVTPIQVIPKRAFRETSSKSKSDQN